MINKRRFTFYTISILLFITLISCNFPLKFVPRQSSRNPANVAPTELPTEYNPTAEILSSTMEPMEITEVEPWNLQLGKVEPLLNMDVGTEGGTYTLSAPGTSLDGFKITIPAGAYEQTVHFTISYSEIQSGNIPSDLTPITPIIDIDNGGVISNDFIDLYLPRQMAPDKFAMLFAYNPENGALEALPLVNEDQSGLTTITTHFSEILGVEVNLEELDNLSIRTGFKQGVNNWQFVNYGTFASYHGHCAGQTLTMVDYFTRFKGDKLYGKFDDFNNEYIKTPNNQYDDRMGLRLVSVAQEAIDWENKGLRYWYRVQGLDPTLSYYSFALALRASGEPQLLGIFTKESGHAIIVYGKFGDTFYVSDPNYPKPTDVRFVYYNRGKKQFDPYNSGPNATNLGTPYPYFYYVNKYYLLNEANLTSLWADLAAGKVGESYFPAYEIQYNMHMPDTSVQQIAITSTYNFVNGTEASFFVDSTEALQFTVYDANNSVIKTITGMGPIKVQITNPLGTPYLFAIFGKIGNEYSWIDGKWIILGQAIAGNWTGPMCDEAEANPYRWEVDITESLDGTIMGELYFHACPGGGVASYNLYGKQKPGENFALLEGTKSGGRGDLGANAAQKITFTIKKNQPPAPNLAP